MADLKEFQTKLTALINNAEQLDDIKFRLILESLVKGADEEKMQALAPYITNVDLTTQVRMNIIRVAGYLQNSLFLVPLKRVIDKEANIRMKQEAIIAVSKFDDRRALNILNTALNNLNNPLLASTINREISRIKQNNPILGLMPRFQEGSRNPKTFKITLQVLKRILTPSDATIFTKYLDMGDPMVENGAFEILCFTGDIFHDTFIIEFYQKHFSQIPCLGEKECEELYWLVMQFEQFLSRYRFLVEEQIPMLKDHFVEIADIRAQTIYISVICRSQKEDSISFMQEVYDEQPSLKTEIIRAFSGNEKAVDFLFDKYHKEKDLQEEAIKSLLNTERGLEHFTKEFFSLPFEVQEMTAQHLPYAGGHDLVDFIRQVFEADIFRLKEILLSKIKENFEFSVKDILFAKEYEREFSFMGEEYIETVTRLFPVAAIKDIFHKIAEQGLSVTKTKKLLGYVTKVVPLELLYTFRDKAFIEKLFNRIILSNNTELNVQFLGILKTVKTLDTETYRVLTACLNLFITQREKNITPAERGELNRTKQSLRDIFYEVKAVEDGRQLMLRVFTESDLDFELLDTLITQNHLSVVTYLGEFVKGLAGLFERANADTIAGWSTFLGKYGRIAALIKPALDEKAHSNASVMFNDLRKISDSLAEEELRLVLNFKNRHFTAILREQFQEMVPHVPVDINEDNTREEDLLLCDAEALSDLILQSKVIPKKIYIFLEKAAAFSAFKSYNPRTFVQPFSFYRIVREILQNLYL